MSGEKKPSKSAGQKKRLFQVAYPCTTKKEVDADIFQLRDGFAFPKIHQALYELNYDYDSPISFYPDRGKEADEELRKAENYSFLSPEDLLVLTTRPPLDDQETKDRKQIPASHNDLEDAIFDDLRAYFSHCSRSSVELSKELVEAYCATHGTKVEQICARFSFRQTHGAHVTSVGTLANAEFPVPAPTGSYKSVAFFVHLPAIRRYGCRFMASFGISGNDTLAWSRIVATRYPEWLEKPCFVVAEMNITNVPKRPVTLHYVDDINVDILLKHDGPPPEIDESSLKPKNKPVATAAANTDASGDGATTG